MSSRALGLLLRILVLAQIGCLAVAAWAMHAPRHEESVACLAFLPIFVEYPVVCYLVSRSTSLPRNKLSMIGIEVFLLRAVCIGMIPAVQ